MIKTVLVPNVPWPLSPHMIKPNQRTAPRGPKRRITDEQVHQVRALVNSGTPRRQVAELFGVHPNTVDRIRYFHTPYGRPQ
jgi:hypothetical protein